jgi:hypothetical protein
MARRKRNKGSVDPKPMSGNGLRLGKTCELSAKEAAD